MILLNTQTAQNNFFGISFVLKLIFPRAVVVSNKKISLAWVLHFQIENFVFVQVCYVYLVLADCRIEWSLEFWSERGIFQIDEFGHHETLFTFSLIDNVICVYSEWLEVFSDLSLNFSHTCPYVRPHLLALSLTLSNEHLFHGTHLFFLSGIKELLKSLIFLPQLSNKLVDLTFVDDRLVFNLFSFVCISQCWECFFAVVVSWGDGTYHGGFGVASESVLQDSGESRLPVRNGDVFNFSYTLIGKGFDDSAQSMERLIDQRCLFESVLIVSDTGFRDTLTTCEVD